MNSLLPSLLAVTTLVSSVSCTLPSNHSAPPKAVALKEGVRYEVRRAIAADAPFNPNSLKSYYVIVQPTRPPMVAAANGSRRTVRTTAYCHDESDHLSYGNRSAVGTPLKFGSVRSAAADWSRYPLGTLFRIANQPGIVYQVDDYGSALVGTDTIDLYQPTQYQMNQWGVRHVDIEVIKWGCYHQSIQLIKDRTRFPHVRQMFNGLQQRLLQATQLPATTPAPLTVML
jgi:3D (Asp-Asp-Asp) domain-containing protein